MSHFSQTANIIVRDKQTMIVLVSPSFRIPSRVDRKTVVDAAATRRTGNTCRPKSIVQTPRALAFVARYGLLYERLLLSVERARVGLYERPEPMIASRMLAARRWARDGRGIAYSRRFLSSKQQVNGLAPKTWREQQEHIDTGTLKGHKTVRGKVLDHSIDLRRARPGDRLDLPYQTTVSETMQDFWFAAFFDQNRIHTSKPFCRKMGLQDRVLPFSLALFLTSSMSHEDAAKVQVGFGKVSYLWPIFSGDTLRRVFTVRKLRNTSDGQHSIISFSCDLINQRDRLCMRADKRLLFQFPVPESNFTSTTVEHEPVDRHLFRDHLLSKATTVLAQDPSHSLASLDPGMMILHTMHRSLTFSQSQQLASLARLTHERHFDSYKYDKSFEIFVPGGLVLGITTSAAARDLHEILHEEVQSCAYINKLHPDNVVGAMSFVHSVEDNLPGDMELVTVTTIGMKNLNVQRDLQNVDIPVELFQPGLFTKEIEKICKEACPVLSGKIVVAVERKILRQTKHREVFLL
jgi:acyl dehydratase